MIDEPYYGYYLEKTGLNHPCRAEILAHQDKEADSITADLLNTDFGSKYLFMKNMPHHMVDLDLSFVSAFDNFFLIREPREMILSYIKKIPAPQMSDLGLDMQYKLFESLSATGKTPAVVDSFELLSNPKGVLEDLCNRLGIPFSEEMINWPAGSIEQDGIWAGYWYANVHASTGFARAVKRKVSDFPESLESLAKECEYYYHEMKKHTWSP